MTDTRKFWAISNTAIVAGVKTELKIQRKGLNSAAGVDETKTSPDQWPYRVIKGPDHPSIKPFFREIVIHSLFRVGKKVFKKLNVFEAVDTNPEGLPIPQRFEAEDQFQLA